MKLNLPACWPARCLPALATLILPWILAVAPMANAQSLAEGSACLATPDAQAPAASVATLGKDWIVKAADNICGLKDASQLSNPAVVDYDALLAATPEMKTMRDQKIDANSPEGIRLSNAAVDRVTKACEEIRTQLGHCSVWKEIRHRDGRTLTDITAKVKAQF
ncbi:MAG: hypothetical protein IT453_14305 [Planctomycetes bacterium]|jgi:hypothetical protein|nr:hypothetical protein [Planctomycetota bacterium]